MNRSGTGGSGQRSRVLNAVPLQNAVLCAECDVVSDSPHATCLVCGSPSLFNIARMFGGKLPKERASLIALEAVGVSSCDVILRFPKPHRLRKRVTVGSRELPVLAREENGYSGRKADERPVRFWLDGKQYQVEAVLDQWYDPQGIFYKVRANDGNIYIIRQQTSTPDGTWDLVSFRRTDQER